jgi:hypothetical protein
MSYNGSGTFNINTAGQPVVTGTVITSTAFNLLTADLASGLTTALTKDGQTTPTANIPMGTFKITGLGAGTALTDAAQFGQLQAGATQIAVVTGTDTLAGTLTPTPTAYATGNLFSFVAVNTNTGAATININSLGAKSITKLGSTALAAGDIVSGRIYLIEYDGTRFQLINPSGVASFSAGTTGFTPSTATTGVVTLAGTLITSNGGTGLSSYTAGDLPYYATGTALSKLGIGTNGQILTSSGTAPQWSTLSGVAVTTFSAGTTGFTPSSATSGAVTLAGTLATTNGGTGLTSFTSGGVVYASSTSALATGSALTFDGTTFSSIASSATAGNFKATSSTAQVLNVTASNDANTTVGLLVLGSAAGSIGMLGAGAPALYTAATELNLMANNASGVIKFAAGGSSEQMRLTSTGLGIGTSSPSYKLDVQAATSVIQTKSTTGTNAAYYIANNTGGDFYIGRENSAGSTFGTTAYSSVLWSAGAYPMAFFTNGTERARIDSSGNLLVGKTATNVLTRGAELLPTGQILSTLAGSTNATDTLDVYSTGAGAYRFYVDMAGTIHATAIVITAISDQRLKENVRDIDTGLSTIMALKPRRFDWKEGKGQDKKNAAGFIAQEFEEVFPECVSTSKAGADGIEYKNINHETLIPTLVKAIQQQQTLIESLTTRLTALEGKA